MMEKRSYDYKDYWSRYKRPAAAKRSAARYGW